MGYKKAYEDLGLEFTDQVGKELMAVCPSCSKENKFSVSAITGLGHCFSCGHSTNLYIEIEKKHGLSGEANFNYQADFGIEFKAVADPQNKEKKLTYPDFTPEREAHDNELEELCSAKGILSKDLRLLTSNGVSFKNYRDDGKVLHIPGFWPDCISHPTAWLRCKQDGGIFIRGDQIAKYPLVKGSTHGFIGLKRIIKDNPDVVIWAEGWKDAIAATNYGYHAVATTGGAGGGWHKNWVELFRNKVVYMIFDADTAGQRYMERVAPLIASVTKATFVCTLPYEVQPSNGKDLFDYCNEKGMNQTRFREELLDKARAIFPERSNVVPDCLPQTLAAELYYRTAGSRVTQYLGRWFEFNYKSNKYTELSTDRNGLPERLVTDAFRMCRELRITKKNKEGSVVEVSFAATQTLVNNIIKNFATFPGCEISVEGDTIEFPVWLDGSKAAKNTIALNNCLLHINSSDQPEILPLTDKYLNTMYLPYDYDPEAECPRFKEFLIETFTGEHNIDVQAIELLQEYCGLFSTPDTSYQTILGLIGAGGTGKGTVLRVIENLIGVENYGTTEFQQLTEQFGLEHLLSCSVAVIPDAHLGHRTCSASAVRVLKTISGEDAITINRKYQTALKNCRMPVRFIIATNTMQALSDPSGALLRRWQFLPMVNTVSAENRDRGLSAKLKEEIPGIFNWALEGLYRLRNRGHFASLESVADLDSEFKALVSPMDAFLVDCCTMGPKEEVSVALLFRAYRWWCEQENFKSGSKPRFAANLRAAYYKLGSRVSRHEGRPARTYVGLGLKESIKSIVITQF